MYARLEQQVYDATHARLLRDVAHHTYDRMTRTDTWTNYGPEISDAVRLAG